MHLHACRGEPGIKVAALNLIAAAVEGLGDNDRNVLAVHAEALKTADRYARDKTCETTTRCHCVTCSLLGADISCDCGHRSVEWLCWPMQFAPGAVHVNRSLEHATWCVQVCCSRRVQGGGESGWGWAVGVRRIRVRGHREDLHRCTGASRQVSVVSLLHLVAFASVGATEGPLAHARS